MDRDEVIITVYCLVCKHYQMIKKTSPLRRGGFAPARSDEEVIPLELCGEYFKLTTDKDLFAYFRPPYAHFFPPLTERFAVARLRVPDLWHFHQRLIRKVLAHTVGVFLNLYLGRPPLDLAGLSTVEPKRVTP